MCIACIPTKTCSVDAFRTRESLCNNVTRATVGIILCIHFIKNVVKLTHIRIAF